MKREYKSPVILVVAINMERHLLTPSNLKSNTNLKLGKGSSVEARSRESSFFADDEDVFDE